MKELIYLSIYLFSQRNAKLTAENKKTETCLPDKIKRMLSYLGVLTHALNILHAMYPFTPLQWISELY